MTDKETMVVQSFPATSYKAPKEWEGRPIEKIFCSKCRSVLCRHRVEKGFVELQCKKCGSFSVVKTGSA